MRAIALFLVMLGVVGCESDDKTSTLVDADGDGISADEDCDDSNAGVGDPVTYYADDDGDGHGDGSNGDAGCTVPVGYSLLGDDCDDANAAVYPGAEDICDGLDNDCNGTIDDGSSSTFYTDADGDGYGDDASATTGCEQPEGTATVGGDCNDADAAYNPGALETDCLDPNDYNCDGSVGFSDNDADGFAACEECDDSNPSTHPGADEVCDGADNDCDGSIDEDPVDGSVWYADTDGDSFGNLAAPMAACEAPVGFVADATDCNDGDATINPLAIEICDGIDNDCDSLVDDADDSLDASSAATWYTDGDGDGYGDDATVVTGCTQPAGTASFGGDCDDTDAAYNPGAIESDCLDPNDYNCDGSVGYADADSDGYAACEECDDTNAANYPGADELCDGADNDCDGTIDEDDAVDASTWYADSDGDTYGDIASMAPGCSAPTGYVADSTDCNDSVAAINPGATEVCDGLDNDCDGAIDDADGSLDVSTGSTWYTDADGDGYGDDTLTSAACAMPSGTSAVSGDCNDADAAYNPGADESDCTDPNDYNCDGSVGYVDADGDGYAACEECDDGSAANYPGSTEFCDGVDNDCDGLVDEADAADASTFYADADGDTFGDPASSTLGCSAPAGYVADYNDCNDGRSDISPAATEVCNGLDDDCDGLTDDADDSLDATSGSVFYTDIDGDGYGDDSAATYACSAPASTTAVGGDCNDADAAYNPGAVEADCTDPNDYNCDGSVNYTDADGDGYAACEECDDASAANYPGATEICDGADNDCDGSVDEAGASGESTWYADSDGDSFGSATATALGCTAPSGYIADSTDCDDSDFDVNPAATEVCNGIDDDCDGTVDNGASDASTWYADADSDGFGDSAVATASCSSPSGYVANSDDCNDASAAINPDATEVCNGIDDDCDAAVDNNASDATTFYADSDADGYGDLNTTVASCSMPAGYLADSSDCDDSDASINPAGIEVCNGLDDDCDGSVDEGATDMLTWYLDNDGDGYGKPTSSTTSCTQPTGYVANNQDCDDARRRVHPFGRETCDGRDEDCDGTIDEGVTHTYYADTDGDTYGNAASTTTGCSVPTGYSSNDDDCDDSTATVHPSATEYCNLVDDDCDGLIDESAVDMTTWYADSDGDTYGDSAVSSTGCSAPAGYIADGTDCDDSRSSVHPGATETCNGRDDDCDGSVDEDAVDASPYYADADNDGFGDPGVVLGSCSAPAGYVTDYTDCDDTDDTVNPDAYEYCNGVDDDCNGIIDDDTAIDASTWFADLDEDGFGDDASTYDACNAPVGYVGDNTDCDDTRYDINPGATEVCNTIDDDCDGLIDDLDASLDLSTASTWYTDADGDGYGNDSLVTVACEAPASGVASGGDCNDADAAYNPGATEVCTDPHDYNCDGSVGYRDTDADGWAACAECDDTNAANYPGAPEYCDGVDNDCDGSVDEGDAVDATTWYADTDGDAYGDMTASFDACATPAGYVADDTDCDDTDADVNPAELEYCNGYDDDCDGSVDENSAVDANTYYRDADGDAYGDVLTTSNACSAPTGYIADSTDCDDTSAAIHPGAAEVCDTLDNDCDGSTDEGGVCPCDVVEYGGHAYMFCTTLGTWTNDHTTCLSYGYDLVSINDAAENAFVVAGANARAAVSAKWWTGGTDTVTEGTWKWSNGDTWSYTNWHSGEPNNVGAAPGEDCMQLGRFSDNTWNDEPCTSPFRYVCEE